MDRNLRLYYDQGVAALENEDEERALECFDRVIEEAPGEADAFYQRGLTWSRLRNYRRAVSDFTDALRLRPKMKMAHYNRAIAYGNLDRPELELADYNEVIGLDPDFGSAYDGRGDCQYRLRNFGESVEDYYRAISIFIVKNSFESAWEVVHKLKNLGWDVDRALMKELVRASGRRR